jgi:hypothetical protein
MFFINVGEVLNLFHKRGRGFEPFFTNVGEVLNPADVIHADVIQ